MEKKVGQARPKTAPPMLVTTETNRVDLMGKLLKIGLLRSSCLYWSARKGPNNCTKIIPFYVTFSHRVKLFCSPLFLREKYKFNHFNEPKSDTEMKHSCSWTYQIDIHTFQTCDRWWSKNRSITKKIMKNLIISA